MKLLSKSKETSKVALDKSKKFFTGDYLLIYF